MDATIVSMPERPRRSFSAPESPDLHAVAPVSDVAPCDEGVSRLWLTGARLLALELERAECTDIKLEECDVSGVLAGDSVLRRCHVTGGRVRGASWSGGQIDDLVVEDCETDELSLRFSRLRRVRFSRCRLPRLDLYAASFEHVSFEDCDLRGAVFSEASVASSGSLRIERCDLNGVVGAGWLRGAEIDAAGIVALAPSLAQDAGIRIRWDDQDVQA